MKLRIAVILSTLALIRGDWISLGGISNEVRQEERSLTGYFNRQSIQNLDLRFRVTELH
ncbi:MAG: hypothetical protein KJ558_11520 [Gammaproteobacteria bacterium]|nr:hypothetical protein [Gammaproteobacteria bacterium]MBU1655434.1 hypothetical protein [Gammaproteobacteria bacterium]MBU1962401.1 hypothetical protein [Gammaproteobacteria bacterium]